MPGDEPAASPRLPRATENEMPLPIIADTVRFACTGTGGSGQPFANVIHCKHTGGAPSAAAITACADILAKLYNPTPTLTAVGGWMALMKSTAVFDKITATVLDGVSASVSKTYGYVGGVNADTLPPSVALVVSMHTAFRGRSFRGRAYLPAPVESHNDAAGHMDGPSAADVVANWTAAIAALSAASWVLSVASYKLAVATPVVAVTVDTVWDSQRRRKV